MSMGPSICVISGIACAAIASGKARSAVGWFILGFMFPVVALILILVIGEGDGPRRRPQQWAGAAWRQVHRPPPVPPRGSSVPPEPESWEPAWYYEADGQAGGPVTVAELREMLGRRKITPATLVWYHPMAKWTPAGKFASLFGAA